MIFLIQHGKYNIGIFQSHGPFNTAVDIAFDHIITCFHQAVYPIMTA